MSRFGKYREKQADIFLRLVIRFLREANHPLTSFQLAKLIIPRMPFSLKVVLGSNPAASKLDIIKVLLAKHARPGGMLVNIKGLGYWPAAYPVFHLGSVPYWKPPKVSLQRIKGEVELAFATEATGTLSIAVLVARMQARGVLLTSYTWEFMLNILTQGPYTRLDNQGPKRITHYRLAAFTPAATAPALVA